MNKVFKLGLIWILILIAAIGCSKPVFNGSRTGNEGQFIMDYSVLSRTENHEMKLQKGDIIAVEIVQNAGKLKLLVTDPDGKEIYRSDNAITSEFSLEIQTDGTYKFEVTGEKAKGSISFKVVD